MLTMGGGTNCCENIESLTIEEMGKVWKMEDERSDKMGEAMLM